MQYLSTRGGSESFDFEAALLRGPAPDGGLLVPAEWPRFELDELTALAALPYEDMALRIMQPFVGDSFSSAELQQCIAAAYHGFDMAERVGLTGLGPRRWLLELYHGPTLAFKDLAMQLLGQLITLALNRRQQEATILGATSGDTGAAAIAAFRGSAAARVFVLFPAGRVSEVQQRQMTTIPDANVHAVAVRGDFDDAQALVKAAFADQEFRVAQSLTAINSINWARIVAQAVYYVAAGLRLGLTERPLRFVVPTGNFGDAYAGYVAKRIGLPIERIVVATNTNDILHRTLATGRGVRQPVVPTASPSMDIQVASNFERALFEATNRHGAVVTERIGRFADTGELQLTPAELEFLRESFVSVRASETEVAATMRDVWEQFGVLVDPHTAVGVHASTVEPGPDAGVMLATAHPAKFPAAVSAATGQVPLVPPSIADQAGKPERFDTIDPDLGQLKDLIAG